MQPAQQVVEVCANVDDATGEVVGDAVRALMDEGALDAWTSAITMKHGRPGVHVSLLCEAKDRDRLARRMIALTGSFGVRFRTWDRLVLDRRHEVIESPYGPVRMKIGSLDGSDIVSKPEFEDVTKAAAARGVTPRQVLASLPRKDT